MSKNNNPNCDGGRCDAVSGEVRVLPYPGGNLILCLRCFSVEIVYRRSRNRELSTVCRYDLPAWSSLEVYGPLTPERVEPVLTPSTCRPEPPFPVKVKP